MNMERNLEGLPGNPVVTPRQPEEISMPFASHPRFRTAGFNLMETMMTLTIVAFVTLFVVTPTLRWWSSIGIELASAEIASAFQLARSYAVRHRANVAVRFETHEDGTLWHSLYRDMDGDGVLKRDIQAGVDRLIRGPSRLAKGGLRFGFPPGPPPRHPSTGKRLNRLHDPIRFNRSDMASFSSRGTATPGTVYLTDGQRLMAVRVTNLTGKVTLLEYDVLRQTWHR